MTRRPLIIDADPGIDDAIAIMMMQASGLFEFKGITAVHGNVPLEYTANNALYLSELYGINCPVAVGARRSMLVSLPKAAAVHGENGLGGFQYPSPAKSFHHKYAWDLIYDAALACEGELELLATGPLTNIAIAALKYPLLRELIKHMVIMAGAARSGNVSPSAEFNVWQDPQAASVVLNFGFKNLTMVDLECCYTGYLTEQEADRMLVVKSPLTRLFETMRLYKRKSERALQKKGAGLGEFTEGRSVYCDAVAAAVMIEPALCAAEPRYVFCETQSVLNFGQTIVDWNSRLGREPNVLLARSVLRDRFKELLFDSIDYYDREKTVLFDEKDTFDTER